MKILILPLLFLLMFTFGCRSFEIHSQTYPIETTAPQLSKYQIRKAIFNACTERGWLCKDVADGAVEARITVRGKHIVVVKISYSSEDYKISYVDSVNMKYKKKADGREFIHSSYSRWVDILHNGINKHITALKNKMVS